MLEMTDEVRRLIEGMRKVDEPDGGNLADMLYEGLVERRDSDAITPPC